MEGRREIDKLGWLCIKDKRLLVARSKGNDTYYIPGGKREAGESDQQALIREINEEVSLQLTPTTIQYAGTFKAQAHGKPEGHLVKVTCYYSEFTGEIRANNEIEKLIWVDYGDKDKCSAVTQIIMDWLKSEGKLESKIDLSKNLSKNETQDTENNFKKSNELSRLNHYDWILFDADDTLFHFDAFSGLKRLFALYNVQFTDQDYQDYHVVNKALWVDYQKGTITAQQLQHRRFNAWAEKLKVSPATLNSGFLEAMAAICTTLDGAVSLLNALKGKVKLGIITNGFTELQTVRLERTGLKGHFDVLVISEQVGVAKPHRGIFDHALSIMGNPARSRVLMVGDNPESDILGGINAGLDTCWLNVNNKPAPKDIIAKYQVSSLPELESFLIDKKPAAVSTPVVQKDSVVTKLASINKSPVDHSRLFSGTSNSAVSDQTSAANNSCKARL